MRKCYLLIAMMLFGMNCAIQAQTDNEVIVTNQEGEQEVIELPEGMTLGLDSLLNQYNSKRYLQRDTNCNYRNVNPVFSKEVYIERLGKLPNIIEMPYNEVVKQVIDRYAGRFRNSVSYMLGASNFYMPIFEQALEEYQLPLELKYLPVIESALNPTAVSHAGAAGLWQFMLNTGKQYGLEVNSLVDERRDPIKASYAAAHYLSDLYKIYRDWNLVIAAYNCGPENINKAIHRAEGETDYWKIYPYLPRETRGYVPAFIAANYIMNYYCDHNICPMVTRLPAKSDTVMVNRNVHMEQIAAVCKLDLDMLRALNPQYRQNIINGNTKPSILRLPDDAVNLFIDNQDSIYAYNVEKYLGRRAEVDIVEEMAQNIRPTRTNVSPRGRKAAAQNDRNSRRHGRDKGKGRHGKSRKRGGGEQSVTVKSGQTLSQIAKKNHTTVEKLRRLNGIKGSNIRAGKKLKVK